MNVRNITYLVLLLFVISCGSDDSEGIDDLLEGGPGTITATIDGVDITFDGLGTNARLDQDRDDIVEFDFRIDGETDKDGFEYNIDLNLFGTDFDLVNEGDVFRGDGEFGELIFSGNYGKISRTPGDDTDIQAATENGIASNQCIFTKIDRTNRLVSGTFTYVAVDIFDENNTFTISNGVFTELSY